MISVSFDGLYNILNNSNNSDIIKTIHINGQKSHVVAVFNKDGKLQEVAVDAKNIENLQTVNLQEILTGAKSHSKGHGRSLITIVINENNN